MTTLDNLIVVLHRTRDVVNIGAVVRAMKNMGLARLRLVEPPPFEPDDVLRLAHRSEDVLDAARRYDTLDAALADTVFVVGTTARARGEHRVRQDVRALAPALLAHAAAGPVALLFGPEDNGLDNQALDRCHALVRLPVDPAYPSLNLAQAAMLLMYELRTAAVPPADAPPAPAATAAQHEQLYDAVARALAAIEFFKAGDAEQKLRVVRRLVQRASPTPEEAALITAMAREVVAFIRRKTAQPER
ncbi:MAG TPA: TrmJ/YjtD family RNA methyltransferase [Roseiflexaceae bacterium]|nr:TrmJ/YjtD family RNA methyltransferase [Roseiflexaceae bacterium]